MALSALGVCLLLFFGGFFIGRSGLSAARSELEKNRTEAAKLISESKSEAQQSQTRLSAQEALLRVAEARNWLYRSAIQLDRKNFGMAQTNLKKATEIIESGSMTAAGFTSAQTESVKQSIAGINLTISEDTEGQRAQILNAAEQFDSVLDSQTRLDATPAEETL